MTFGEKVHCVGCLMPSAFEVRADKRGRPYGICECCGMRVFFRGANSLRGLTFLWGPLVRAMDRGDRAAAEVMLEDGAKKAEVDHEQRMADGGVGVPG